MNELKEEGLMPREDLMGDDSIRQNFPGKMKNLRNCPPHLSISAPIE